MSSNDKKPSAKKEKKEKRPRGRPRVLTDEQKKELTKIRNANRGYQPRTDKYCDVCQYSIRSQNYSRHFTSRRHADNIKQLETDENIHISPIIISE